MAEIEIWEGLAELIEPDGGMPVRNDQERWAATATALFQFLANGYPGNPSSNAKHVKKLLEQLKSPPFTAIDERTRKDIYETNAFASIAARTSAIHHQHRPGILVEGPRDLPEADRPLLVALGQMLARNLPRAVFRTGNVTGSDTAFAEGVAAVDVNCLQYVLPHAGMGRQRRRAESPAVALDAVPAEAEQVLASATASASPPSQQLVESICPGEGLFGPCRRGGVPDARHAQGAGLRRTESRSRHGGYLLRQQKPTR